MIEPPIREISEAGSFLAAPGGQGWCESVRTAFSNRLPCLVELGANCGGQKTSIVLAHFLSLSWFSSAFMRKMTSLLFPGSRARLRVSSGSFFRSKSWTSL